MRPRRLCLMAAAATAGLWAAPVPAGAQQLLSESFSGVTTSAPLVSLNSNSGGLPCLTAGTNRRSTPVAGCGLPIADPVGSGVLRLTNASPNQAAGVVFAGSFPTHAGLDITFDQYQYGGTGGDGISFDLAVAPPQPTAIGQSGGSLGYGTSSLLPSGNGMPGGYLGVGLDAYGNFTSTLFDGSGCTTPTWAGLTRFPNEVTVRGPGNGTAGYCLLSSSLELSPNPLGPRGFSLRGTSGARSPRSVDVKIDPISDTYTVGIDPAGGASFQTVTSGPLPSSYFSPATGASVSGIPPRLTFAFAASTGYYTDVHEIGDVTASTVDGSVPVLTLANTASTASASGSTPVTYRLLAGVSAQSPAGESDPASMQVTDPIPAGESLSGTPSGSGWNCSASTALLVSCADTATAPLAPGATLPAISVPVTIWSVAPRQILDTAQLISADAAAAVTGSASLAVPPGPGVIAGSATVTGQRATFTATVIPNGSATDAYFVYGLDPVYGLTSASEIYTDQTADDQVGSDTSAHIATATVTGLVPHALYHVRVVATSVDGITTGPDQTFTTAALPAPHAPVIGKEANFTPVSGNVYVKTPPGAHIAGLRSDLDSRATAALTKGAGFFPLTEARQLPIGTEVDARAGTLKLTTATTARRKTKVGTETESGDFSLGLFQVLQSAKRSLKGLTTLRLLDSGIFPGAPSYSTECPSVGKKADVPSGRSLARGRLSKRVLQTLKASEHGNYRTAGRYSATVRGTAYSVSDRCDGTLTAAKRGEVVVTDYRRPKKLITLRAGHRYLAKAP